MTKTRELMNQLAEQACPSCGALDAGSCKGAPEGCRYPSAATCRRCGHTVEAPCETDIEWAHCARLKRAPTIGVRLSDDVIAELGQRAHKGESISDVVERVLSTAKHGLQVLAGVAVGAMLSAAPVEAQTRQHVEMTQGLIRIVRAPEPYETMILGDPEVADTLALSDRRIAITAKKAGYATVLLLTAEREIVAEIAVAVVPTHQAGRRPVTVTAFEKDRFIVHRHHCNRDAAAACFFEKSEPNLVPPPIISTGPVIQVR